MANYFLELLIIFLLLLANGVFAMSEIAVVSARKVRLQQLANEGNHQAQTALELVANPNQFFSTIQFGISLVGIFTGAFGGATLATKIGQSLDHIPLLAPYSGAIGVGIVVLCLTYLSLIVGELVPKRLALNNPERIAALVAPSMQKLSFIASPVVWLLSISTETVVRLLGIKRSTEPSITEEEIRVLIEQGREVGAIEAAEQDMIESVLRLDDRLVNGVMTPRPQIVWLDLADSPDEWRQKVAQSHHARFPVIDGELDNVLGIVHTKDLFAQTITDGESPDLKPLLRDPLFVPENITVLRVLELFKHKRLHVALVIDEYGSVEGLVTSTDILESIVGDIPSTEMPIEGAAVQRDDGSWLIDGMLSIEQLKELLDLDSLPDEQQGSYQTVAGFVISQLGVLPAVGQHFEWHELRFEVVDMDGRRIDKVLVTPHAPSK